MKVHRSGSWQMVATRCLVPFLLFTSIDVLTVHYHPRSRCVFLYHTDTEYSSASSHRCEQSLRIFKTTTTNSCKEEEEEEEKPPTPNRASFCKYTTKQKMKKWQLTSDLISSDEERKERRSEQQKEQIPLSLSLSSVSHLCPSPLLKANPPH